jgi:hypothetical protein
MEFYRADILRQRMVTFLVRLALPSDSSFLKHMHLGDFPQYVLLFSAGIFAGNGSWLPKLSFLLGVRWLGIVMPFGFAAWFVILKSGGAFTGNGAAFSGGWH